MFKHKRILSILAIIVVVGGILGLVFGYLPWREERAMASELAANEYAKQYYAHILEREKKLKENPQDIEQYLGLAFDWKSVGDALNNKKYYRKGIIAAEEGLDRFPRHALLNINAGNLYKELDDYENAEKRFRKAIDSAPGDPQTYLLLIDLYKYNLKKSEAEIVKVYQEGLSRLVNIVPLLNSFALYLRDTGQKERALDFYRELQNAVPANQAYKQAVEELEQELTTKS